MAKAQGLAMAFGAMSSGIGAWYAAAPRQFLSVIGAPPTRRRIIVTRLVAAQELAVGGSLIADGRATRWLGSRVAGDVLHAAMLALAYRAPDTDKRQMRVAWGAWLGLTAADVAATAAARRIERTGVESDEPTGSTPEAGAVADGSIRRSITIYREPADVYGFWRQLDNLPRFMKHLERVDVLDERRSHWVARAPLGTHVAWDAEITDDRPSELIAWQSTGRSAIWNAGEVKFVRAPGDRGTEVHVRLDYSPPGGPVGKAVARLLGEAPSNQISGDLRRFKQILEAGEVIVSDAVAEGRSRRQRPAQPIPIAA